MGLKIGHVRAVVNDVASLFTLVFFGACDPDGIGQMGHIYAEKRIRTIPICAYIENHTIHSNSFSPQ